MDETLKTFLYRKMPDAKKTFLIDSNYVIIRFNIDLESFKAAFLEKINSAENTIEKNIYLAYTVYNNKDTEFSFLKQIQSYLK